MADLYLLGVKRLARKGGIARMSREALEYLRDVGEKILIEISRIAAQHCEEKKKRMVDKEDIKYAIKALNLPIS